jgi:hypothetical protein
MRRYPLAIATVLLMIVEVIGTILTFVPLIVTMVGWFFPLAVIAIFGILAPVEILMCLYVLIWLAFFVVSILTRGDARYSKRLTARRERFTKGLHIEDRLDKVMDVVMWPCGLVLEHMTEPLVDDIERRYKWLNGK